MVTSSAPRLSQKRIGTDKSLLDEVHCTNLGMTVHRIDSLSFSNLSLVLPWPVLVRLISVLWGNNTNCSWHQYKLQANHVIICCIPMLFMFGLPDLIELLSNARHFSFSTDWKGLIKDVREQMQLFILMKISLVSLFSFLTFHLYCILKSLIIFLNCTYTFF